MMLSIRGKVSTHSAFVGFFGIQYWQQTSQSQVLVYSFFLDPAACLRDCGQNEKKKKNKTLKGPISGAHTSCIPVGGAGLLAF